MSRQQRAVLMAARQALIAQIAARISCLRALGEARAKLLMAERRDRMVPRRQDRISSIYAGYERRGDELIEFYEIAQILALTVPGVTLEALKQHFVFTVRRGAFPVPGAEFRDPKRHAVRGLIDLHNYSTFAAGAYVLRPSAWTVMMAPLAMHARRSIWVEWIRSQGWPMPPAMTFEHRPAERSSSPLPGELPVAPEEPAAAAAMPRTIPIDPITTEADAAWAYVDRLAAERATTGYAASRQADFDWAAAQKPFRITQGLIKLWRSLLLTTEEHAPGKRRAKS